MWRGRSKGQWKAPQSLPKYLIISDFSIGRKCRHIRNISPSAVWYIPGDKEEYSVPLTSTMGDRGCECTRLVWICRLQWRGKKSTRRKIWLVLSYRSDFSLPAVSGLPSLPSTMLHRPLTPLSGLLTVNVFICLSCLSFTFLTRWLVSREQGTACLAPRIPGIQQALDHIAQWWN